MKTNIFQLIVTSDFEKMTLYLANKSELYLSRQLLDRIRHTTPEYSSRKPVLFVKVGDSFIMIGALSPTLEIALGQQVEFEDSLPELEIASVLLQELAISAHCFPYNIVPNTNAYKRKADQLIHKLVCLYAYDTQDLDSDEMMDVVDYRRLHRNRAKRMRDHRIECRISVLNRMAKVSNWLELSVSLGIDIDQRIWSLCSKSFVREYLFTPYDSEDACSLEQLIAVYSDLRTQAAKSEIFAIYFSIAAVSAARVDYIRNVILSFSGYKSCEFHSTIINSDFLREGLFVLIGR